MLTIILPILIAIFIGKWSEEGIFALISFFFSSMVILIAVSITIKHNNNYVVISKYEIVPVMVGDKTSIIQESKHGDRDGYTFVIKDNDDTQQLSLNKEVVNVTFNCEQNMYILTQDVFSQWLALHIPATSHELCVKGVE